MSIQHDAAEIGSRSSVYRRHACKELRRRRGLGTAARAYHRSADALRDQLLSDRHAGRRFLAERRPGRRIY